MISGLHRRISQTSKFFETFLGMLKSIHMANSAPMSEMLIKLAGVSMDKHMAAEPKLRTFWNTYCCARPPSVACVPPCPREPRVPPASPHELPTGFTGTIHLQLSASSQPGC